MRVDRELRRTDKTLLVEGDLSGQPAVAKVALDQDPFWLGKWRHEIDVYRAFATSPPQLRVPRLLYTDEKRVLVLEKLDGRLLDHERYPAQAVTDADLTAVLAALGGLTAWATGRRLLGPVFDYPDRIRRYYAAGYLADDDRDALTSLLAHRHPWQINHGDPLPSNLLLTSDGCVPLDWEFTGTFLPGFDLAMLHALLVNTPAAGTAIDRIVNREGITEPFVINLAMVLTRELRIHHGLLPGPLREARLPLIEFAWGRARDRLHAVAARPESSASLRRK